MDMHAAYQEVGSYRAAAEICGTTDKTIKRAVEKARAAETTRADEVAVAHNYDLVTAIIAERVAKTEGRISAKRLLPVVRAAGYSGSARNLRRAVAEAKVTWRIDHHRGRRPGVWALGDMLVFDWGGDRSPVRVLRRAGVESVPLRVLRRQPASRDHHGRAGPMHGDHRRRAEDPPHRSHGVPEGRNGGRACRPHAGLRAFRHPLPID